MSKTKTRDELRNAIGHLVYEVTMFLDLAEILRDKYKERQEKSCDANPTPTDNAVLESFTIHARCLIGFFTVGNTPPRDTDVTCVDFGLPAVSRQPKSPIDTAYQRVGKEIAHITTERKEDPKKKQWNIEDVVTEVKSLLESFGKSLPDPQNTTDTQIQQEARDEVNNLLRQNQSQTQSSPGSPTTMTSGLPSMSPTMTSGLPNPPNRRRV